jgi:hypothetical protein
MHVTLALDDELVTRARALTGIAETSKLVAEALNALIARERARQAASLGGCEPEIDPAPRRRR